MIPAIRSVRMLRKHWKLTAIAVFSLSIAMALGARKSAFVSRWMLGAGATILSIQIP